MVLTENQARKFEQRFTQMCEEVYRERCDAIDKYGVQSNQNFSLLKIEKNVEAIGNFFKQYQHFSRNSLIIDLHGGALGFTKRESQRKDFCSIADGLVTIFSAGVNEVDTESETWQGKISWTDNIEDVNTIDSWVAHKLPTKIAEGSMKPYVRPTELSFTGGYHFTLSSEMNEGLRAYIEPLLSLPK